MPVDYYTDTREDTIDAEEYRLYEMIMEYRASLGLPSIPLSKALTTTASRHVVDTVYNQGGYDGHNWSDAPYDASNPATYPAIWEAPERVGTGYTDNGFEISTGYIGDPFSVPNMTAELALANWQGSAPHNDVITQQGPWTQDWQAIGIAIHESVSHVWFGHAPDVSGMPEFEADVGPEGDGEVVAPVVDGVTQGTANADILIGTDENDIIAGGASSDVLHGGPGDDVIFAGSTQSETGTADTARFDGQSSGFQIWGGIEYAVVIGPNGDRDKLFGVEFLQFDDGIFTLAAGSALDGAGAPGDFVVAERVALLYEAALNRDGNIDLPGLNFYIEVAERNNLSDAFLAQDLMKSPEFTQNFGDVDNMSNAAFLEQIYLNVLDRPSDSPGRKFYLDLLDEGVIGKALALADIAVSTENTKESTAVLTGLYESTDGQWAFL